jgi:hypothetical protein
LKEIQCYFVANGVPICQNKWDTQFKLLHNIVYTKEWLQRMGLSLNGSCHVCKEKETVLHLFVHCKFFDSVWIEVFNKFNDFFLRTLNILAEKSE